jgi:hypothetical protein
VFVVHSVTEAIAKHLLEAAPRLSQFAHVPAELDDLVAAMLAKDPAERPGLDQVWEAMDRAATPPARPSEPPPFAVVPTAPAMARPAVPVVVPARRSRLRALAVLAAAVAVATVALAWAFLARSRPERAELRDEVSASAEPSRAAAGPLPGADVVPAAPARTVARPSEPPAAQTSPPEASAAPPPEVPAAVTPPPEAPAAVTPPPEAPTAEPTAQIAATAPAGPAATAEPTGSPAAADPAGPASDAGRSEASAPTGEGKPRGAATPRTRSRRPGRLELAIRGARSYLVVVDGVAQGARSGFALAPGSHAIEVRAAGELPRRFTVQIEPGKTAQRDVAWTHAARPPAGSTPAPASTPAPRDDGALMGPGEAVPRETPRP